MIQSLKININKITPSLNLVLLLPTWLVIGVKLLLGYNRQMSKLLFKRPQVFCFSISTSWKCHSVVKLGHLSQAVYLLCHLCAIRTNHRGVDLYQGLSLCITGKSIRDDNLAPCLHVQVFRRSATRRTEGCDKTGGQLYTASLVKPEKIQECYRPAAIDLFNQTLRQCADILRHQQISDLKIESHLLLKSDRELDTVTERAQTHYR